MSNSFGRKIFSKLSLKSSRSSPIITNHEIPISSKSMGKTNSLSLALNIKSDVILNDHNVGQESQQHLDAMHKIVDQTDNDLRRALEHTAHRHEQLDELHFRSEEMLSKNENLVFGITNYRKTQQRDLFWRRFQYSAFGAITIGIIILIIILSMTNKRPMPSTQVIDIKHSNKDITSTMILSTSRRKREIFNGLLSSKSKHFFLFDNNL